MHQFRFESFIIQIEERLDAIQSQWDFHCKQLPFFLQSLYLKELERCHNRPFKQRYCCVMLNSKCVGVAVLQSLQFNLSGIADSSRQKSGFWTRMAYAAGRNISSCLGNKASIELHCIGNQTISGTHGFYFVPEISNPTQIQILEKILDAIHLNFSSPALMQVDLIKDFGINSQLRSKTLPGPLIQNLEPEMVLDIPEKLSGIEDYIALFEKKYRNRYKSIVKKASALHWKVLTPNEVNSLSPELDALYESVFQKSEIKMLQLPQGYFSNLNACFPDTFQILGGFINERLVVFGSCIHENAQSVYAHYIGLDPNLEDMELYQNLLYRFIDFAIVHQISKIHFGRTAAEIKSTVGAVPSPLTVWIYPRGRINQWAIQTVLKTIKPKSVTYRSPFKTSQTPLKLV